MSTGNRGATRVAGLENAYSTARGDQIVFGARASTDVATARRVTQYTGEMKTLDETAPLTAFIDQVGKKGSPVGQAVAQHNERDVIPTTVTLDTSTYSSGALTLNFQTGTGGQVVAGTVLKCIRTGEVFRVSSKTDVDTAVVVTRGFLTSGQGGAAAAATVASEELQILGTAFGQNSDAPNGTSVEPLIVKSRLQCFRESIEASRRDINSDNYGKSEWDRQKDDKFVQLQQQLEKAFLFNQGYSDTEPTMTDGLINQIVTNVWHMGGLPLDETTLEDFTCAITRYNTKDKSNLVMLCGDNYIKNLDAIARDAFRSNDKTEWLGVDVQGFQCGFGRLKIKQHGMFGPIGSGETAANGGYVGLAVCANIKNLSKLVYRGSQYPLLDKDAASNGKDGEKWCWTYDCGLEMWLERTHGLIDQIAAP